MEGLRSELKGFKIKFELTVNDGLSATLQLAYSIYMCLTD